jgi:hypothetical protein
MTRLESCLATGTDGRELTVFLRGKMGDSEGGFLLDSGNLYIVSVSQHLVQSEVRDATAPTDIQESAFKFENLSTEPTT